MLRVSKASGSRPNFICSTAVPSGLDESAFSPALPPPPESRDVAGGGGTSLEFFESPSSGALSSLDFDWLGELAERDKPDEPDEPVEPDEPIEPVELDELDELDEPDPG